MDMLMDERSSGETILQFVAALSYLSLQASLHRLAARYGHSWTHYLLGTKSVLARLPWLHLIRMILFMGLKQRLVWARRSESLTMSWRTCRLYPARLWAEMRRNTLTLVELALYMWLSEMSTLCLAGIQLLSPVASLLLSATARRLYLTLAQYLLHLLLTVASVLVLLIADLPYFYMDWKEILVIRLIHTSELICQYRSPQEAYSAFHYNVLDTSQRQIRLIKVGRRRLGRPLACSIDTFALDDAPSYEALSYTWANQQSEHLMAFDGAMLKVTWNVRQMLYDRASFQQHRWLWIDAVCIDQADLSEKQSQVGMMGEIYQRADHVFCWLGGRDARASDWQRICRIARQKKHRALVAGTRADWMAFGRVFAHPYWKRVWIIQEIALGSKVFVSVGEVECDFGMIVEMAMIINGSSADVQMLASNASVHGISSKALSTTMFHLMAIHEIKSSFEGDDPRLTIESCLRRTERAEATDPRDKIYAVQHLARRGEVGKGDPFNRADYRITPQTLFTEVAVQLLIQCPEFILTRAGIGWVERPPLHLLPSWAPDFAARKFSFITMDEAVVNAEARYKSGGEARISVEPVPGSVGDLGLMRVAAFMHSTIDHLSTAECLLPYEIGLLSNTLENSWHKTFNDTLRDALSMTADFPDIYEATGQSQKEAFWRTLLGDRHIAPGDAVVRTMQRPALSTYEAHFQCYCKMAGIGQPPSNEEWRKLPSLANRPDLQRLYEEESAVLFCRASIATQNRFATSANGLMGFVPPYARLGDIVAVIEGFERPILLRKVCSSRMEGMDYASDFQLVGACYFHGLMDGELTWQGVSAQDIFLQ